jgi:hypothetical protein
MNLLLIRREDGYSDLAAAVRAVSMLRSTDRCSFDLPIPYAWDLRRLKFQLQELQWTQGPAPSAMFFVQDNANFDQALIAARVAARDGCLFYLLFPTSAANVDSWAMEQQIMGIAPQTFALHNCPLDSLSDLMASLLVRLADSGYFGRYKVVIPSGRNPQKLEVVTYQHRKEKR